MNVQKICEWGDNGETLEQVLPSFQTKEIKGSYFSLSYWCEKYNKQCKITLLRDFENHALIQIFIRDLKKVIQLFKDYTSDDILEMEETGEIYSAVARLSSYEIRTQSKISEVFRCLEKPLEVSFLHEVFEEHKDTSHEKVVSKDVYREFQLSLLHSIHKMKLLFDSILSIQNVKKSVDSNWEFLIDEVVFYCMRVIFKDHIDMIEKMKNINIDISSIVCLKDFEEYIKNL